MLKFFYKILTISFFLIFLIPIKTNSQDKVRNVVVFCAYDTNLPAYGNILAGLKNTISGNRHEPVNLMVEYLDLGRSHSDDYPRFIIDLYNNKLKQFSVDLLITIGPGLNNALIKYADSSFKNLNTISIDLDMPGKVTLADMNIKNGKEIILKFQVRNSIKQALDLFPEHRNVFVIAGKSRLDSYFSTLIRQCVNEFEPVHNFNFVPTMTMDSTIRFVRAIPANSIVLIPAYIQDAADVPFSTPEVLEIITRNCPAPVFLPITDAGVKTKGGVGGYLFSYDKLGKEIGKIANGVLNGKRIQDMTINENGFYEHFYNWAELERWHLTDSKLIPSGSIFYNRDTSFLKLYKWYILGVFLFILSQTILIIYLIRLNRRQKAISIKMEETESMHRELIRTDRLAKMSTLTASLSHELFQPLAAIRLTAEAGKKFIETNKLDNDKASRMFDNILEDNIRATKIISSVKSLMKTETPEKENVTLNALISETADIIRTEVYKKGIDLRLGCVPDKVVVFGSKIQLQQVLMNFIRNAAAAMEKNDQGNRTMEIILRIIKDEAIVSVRDTGEGINDEVREKLFKPFVSTKKDGFGIGLTLCKSLIENHNGKIWAEDIPGGGTMFSFSLKAIRNE
jgi:signal transduction histidine kinase